MKKSASLISAGLILCALPLHAQGTLKVGTVDVRRVLAEYSKAKEDANKIKDAADQAKKELDERAEAYKKVEDEIGDLSKQLESPALSADAKAQKTKARDDKMANRQNLEREITEFQRTRQRQIQEQAMRVQEAILKDITDVVREKVKANNLDLVLDKSGASISGVPALMYSRDNIDLTNDVITSLNKSARASNPSAEKSPSKENASVSPAPKKP